MISWSLIVTVGGELQFRSKKFTHISSIISSSVGPTYQFNNEYAKTGGLGDYLTQILKIVTDHVICSYLLQKEAVKQNQFNKCSFLSFHYAAGLGLNLNRTKEHYLESVQPVWLGYYFQNANGVNEYEWETEVATQSRGVGIFGTLRAGFDINGRKHKRITVIDMFWNQGFKTMQEYTIRYRYQNNIPSLASHEVTNLKLRSKGANFGLLWVSP